MKPTELKNVKLTKKYPFTKEILEIPLEPLDPTVTRQRVDDLTIRVEKADGDLLYRVAENTGLGELSFFYVLKGKHKGLIEKRGEYIFAVDSHGNIINRISWPRNMEEDRGKEALYTKAILFACHSGSLLSGWLGDKIEYLVWITVETWHVRRADQELSERMFGELRERSVEMTIYKKPDCGFAELMEKSNVYENLYLTSTKIMTGQMRNDHNIIIISGMLAELCKLFQDEVYCKGMKEILDNGKFRGASGILGPVKVLCAEMCGYDRAQLEDAESWISFQLRPGAKNMHVLGVGGKLPQIRNLIRTAVNVWTNNPKSREAFKSDKKVSIC